MKYNKKRKLKNLIHWSPEQMGFAIPEMVKTRDNCDGQHIEIKISIQKMSSLTRLLEFQREVHVQAGTWIYVQVWDSVKVKTQDVHRGVIK